jgi:hypothetical protein
MSFKRRVLSVMNAKHKHWHEDLAEIGCGGNQAVWFAIDMAGTLGKDIHQYNFWYDAAAWGGFNTAEITGGAFVGETQMFVSKYREHHKITNLSQGKIDIERYWCYPRRTKAFNESTPSTQYDIDLYAGDWKNGDGNSGIPVYEVDNVNTESVSVVQRIQDPASMLVWGFAQRTKSLQAQKTTAFTENKYNDQPYGAPAVLNNPWPWGVLNPSAQNTSDQRRGFCTNTIVDGFGMGAVTYRNITPFMSQAFCRNFKIRRGKHLTMEPGSSMSMKSGRKGVVRLNSRDYSIEANNAVSPWIMHKKYAPRFLLCKLTGPTGGVYPSTKATASGSGTGPASIQITRKISANFMTQANANPTQGYYTGGGNHPPSKIDTIVQERYAPNVTAQGI